MYLRWRSLFTRDPDVFTPHGIPIRVPPHADLTIRYGLARGQPYEAPEARMVREFLRTGMNVLEMGGCLGVVSATIRNRIGPDPRHVVVEAIPELAEICRSNAMIGAAPGATEVVNAAVDYSGSPTVLFQFGKNAHVGRLARGEAEGIKVSATTLSSLAQRLPPGPFALVCDIEGAEIELVEREPEVFSRVSVFILETHPRFYPGREADRDRLVAAILGRGFRLADSESDVRCFVRDDGAGR